MTDDQAEADRCRPVEVDGQTIRVLGGREPTAKEREYIAEVIRAAKRKYLAEHPEAAHDGPSVAQCHCRNGYDCPHSCWHCKASRTDGCEPWCHVRPFEDSATPPRP